MEKKLTIAICTYNRVKLLLETMESLAMLNSIKKAEVLIVDNNSSDNNESEVAKFIQNAN
ncbi:glycosyltransferase, partial [Escherichia coli]|uniref:glycosyltransferase family 2 protein n=1 Tax=Escherichia coli TaxID=562 RepID=UPI003314D4D2